MAMKIGITGATGFIGGKLTTALSLRGDHVVAFSRNAAKAQSTLSKLVAGAGQLTVVEANLAQPGDWQKQLGGLDAVIHLAGESVGGKRWDARQKQVLRDSRVEATHILVEGIAAQPESMRPKTLVSSSGTDYYPFADTGSFDDDEVTEKQANAEHFLGRLCRDWEREAMAASAAGVRVAVMRTGIVLGAGGAAMEKINTAFKFFVGGPIGSGKQWFSWVHIDDVVNAFLFAIAKPAINGPVNLVAPGTIRQIEFARALGKALHRPSFMPAPAFAIKLAVGAEFAEYLLNGRRVVPAALLQHGFSFAHSQIETAVSKI
jgi:uncharacterized protein